MSVWVRAALWVISSEVGVLSLLKSVVGINSVLLVEAVEGCLDSHG